MPRDYEIMIAFRQAVKRYAAGRYTISTLDFINELDRFDWHYTLRAANKWIEMHTTTFCDITATDGDERLFQEALGAPGLMIRGFLAQCICKELLLSHKLRYISRG